MFFYVGLSSTNSSIVVYMTQLYVYKGLKLTEYAYYESEATNYGASLVKEITEGNVFEYRWFRTFRPFLVLEFELDRLEGNHVRILDDLLDVYGFNVTYQMTEEEPNPNACSVSECSFTGNCLLSADYTYVYLSSIENFPLDFFIVFDSLNTGLFPASAFLVSTEINVTKGRFVLTIN